MSFINIDNEKKQKNYKFHKVFYIFYVSTNLFGQSHGRLRTYTHTYKRTHMRRKSSNLWSLVSRNIARSIFTMCVYAHTSCEHNPSVVFGYIMLTKLVEIII